MCVAVVVVVVVLEGLAVVVVVAVLVVSVVVVGVVVVVVVDVTGVEVVVVLGVVVVLVVVVVVVVTVLVVVVGFVAVVLVAVGVVVVVVVVVVVEVVVVFFGGRVNSISYVPPLLYFSVIWLLTILIDVGEPLKYSSAVFGGSVMTAGPPGLTTSFTMPPVAFPTIASYLTYSSLDWFAGTASTSVEFTSFAGIMSPSPLTTRSDWLIIPGSTLMYTVFSPVTLGITMLTLAVPSAVSEYT